MAATVYVKLWQPIVFSSRFDTANCSVLLCCKVRPAAPHSPAGFLSPCQPRCECESNTEKKSCESKTTRTPQRFALFLLYCRRLTVCAFGSYRPLSPSLHQPVFIRSSAVQQLFGLRDVDFHHHQGWDSVGTSTGTLIFQHYSKHDSIPNLMQGM